MKGKYLWIIVTRKHPLLTLIVALALAANPSVTLLAAQVPGPQYLLSFQKTDGEEPVTELLVCTPSVCEELVLKAHIQDSSGNPAQRGLVIVQ